MDAIKSAILYNQCISATHEYVFKCGYIFFKSFKTKDNKHVPTVMVAPILKKLSARSQKSLIKATTCRNGDYYDNPSFKNFCPSGRMGRLQQHSKDVF